MNLNEFQNNLHQMQINILNKGCPLDAVEIILTKSSGDNILAAIYGERVVDYFKW